MEYVPSGSISTLLQKLKKFPEPLIQIYTIQILHGLIYLHSNNIFHSDLKCANVLVDKNGIVKLTDFGISRSLIQKIATGKDQETFTSPNWIAPEVLKGTEFNDKSDIWSLGCSIIEMLTGSAPWKEAGPDIVHHIIESQKAPKVPVESSSELVDFLKYCFEMNPIHRPTAQFFIEC